MGLAPIAISTQRGQEWRNLSRKLRETGQGELKKELRKSIAKAGKPVVAEVQQVVRSLPVSGQGGTTNKARRSHNVSRARSESGQARAKRGGGGLRETVANATGLKMTARGIRIVVSSNRFPADQRNLPRYLDGKKGWRHPVFGNRERWVAQRAKPYFANTIIKRAPAFRSAINDAMETTKRKLEQ